MLEPRSAPVGFMASRPSRVANVSFGAIWGDRLDKGAASTKVAANGKACSTGRSEVYHAPDIATWAGLRAGSLAGNKRLGKWFLKASIGFSMLCQDSAANSTAVTKASVGAR